MSEQITPAELLTLIEERAPGLRRAGVQEVAFAGCSVKLAPDDIEPPEGDGVTESSDPLNDHRTFGGSMPEFRHLHRRDDS